MSSRKLFIWLFSRAFLCLFFISVIQRDLFIPFLAQPNFNFVDPWSSWLDSSGRTDAFPYGYVMYIFFLPAILLSRILRVGSIDLNIGILMTSTLLVIEFFLFKLLNVFDLHARNSWSWFVILSPLPMYTSFVHGQIDLIPTSLMALASFYSLKNSWFKAGMAVGFAIAAKFSFALAIPFFLLFFSSKKARHKNGFSFARGVTPGLVFMLLPMTFSKAYKIMVLDTPEVLKTLDARINVGVSTLYLVPIAYLMVLLIFWNLNQISNLVMISFVGAAFLVIALTQTSSIGWFYWGFPLILLVLREASVRTLFLFAIWQTSVCFYFVYREGYIPTRFTGILQLNQSGNVFLEGLIFTFNIVLGAVLISKILHEAQKIGDVYFLAERPISLNIAGDSGVGKDTLSNEIAKLFGEQEVALLLGDDYHLHERDDASWLTTTHLSVDANDLEAMGRDFRKLLNREQVFVKYYNHSIGRFTLPRKIKSSQVIIVNGLHTHLIPGSEFSDLKVFLSMDEELRIQFKLERDMAQREYADEVYIKDSIAARVPHYKKYVQPQGEFSDLHLHLKRISSSPLRLGIVVKSKDAAFLHDFRNSFNAVSDIPATYIKFEGSSSLEIDPAHFKSADALLIFNQNVEFSDQLFPSEPKFSDGSVGVLSLVALLALIRKRRNYV
jgi:uridine kinase